MAFGVYAAAKEVGIRIPDDLDVICFGNAKVQNIISPPLSCVDQPTVKIAGAAMELMFDAINDPDEALVRQELIQTELILRETCVKFNRINNPGGIKYKALTA